MKKMIYTYCLPHNWISLGLVLASLFCFQLLNIIYGFEVEDTGFHLVAYEHIFDAPESITYNFAYYLTNVIGGMTIKLFPFIGVLGFRIMGALCVLFTMFIFYVALRKEIPLIHFLVGFSLVIFSYIKAPYSFNNGILSCCLYALSIIVLYKGLMKDKTFLVLAGGVIVGLNLFSRIPNVLAMGMIIIVFYNKILFFSSNKYDWKNSCLFILGVVLGIFVILSIMIYNGHVGLFIRSLNLFFFMANGNSSHGLLMMLKIHSVFYMSALIPVLILYALSRIDEKFENNYKTIVKVSSYTIILLSIFYYILETRFVYVLLWGLFALGCVLCVLKNKNNLGLFAILALYMLVIEIYGSDSGINHGSLPSLLAAPIASLQLVDRRKIKYVIIFIFASFWQVMKSGCFLDVGPLNEKTETIHNKETEGILTTQEKAFAINSTLMGIKPFVVSSDTMICFPSAPMMNYLTHTRPAGGTCWVGVNGDFVLPINGYPKILFNKVNFSGDRIEIRYHLEDKYGFDIKSFIEKHHYQKAFENPYFILYIPSFI